jgi:glutamate--cysteine ligase
VLEHLHEQYLLPPLHAGWTVRRKSLHFRSYEEVAKKFAKLLGMDPWLINPMYAQCGEVSFNEPNGLECVQSNVEVLLGKIRRKYKEYGINEKPFVVVKADNGTYGMGIMTVRDAKELSELNRRTRNKMSVIKDGQEVTEVIIQEGVLTNERVNDAVAEPVVYMIDRYVVGGFYRVHAERGVDENLNAPGAGFVPLAFDQSRRSCRARARSRAPARRTASTCTAWSPGWRCWRRPTSSKPPTPTPRSTSSRAVSPTSQPALPLCLHKGGRNIRAPQA